MAMQIPVPLSSIRMENSRNIKFARPPNRICLIILDALCPGPRDMDVDSLGSCLWVFADDMSWPLFSIAYCKTVFQANGCWCLVMHSTSKLYNGVLLESRIPLSAAEGLNGSFIGIRHYVLARSSWCGGELASPPNYLTISGSLHHRPRIYRC